MKHLRKGEAWLERRLEQRGYCFGDDSDDSSSDSGPGDWGGWEGDAVNSSTMGNDDNGSGGWEGDAVNTSTMGPDTSGGGGALSDAMARAAAEYESIYGSPPSPESLQSMMDHYAAQGLEGAPDPGNQDMLAPGPVGEMGMTDAQFAELVQDLYAQGKIDAEQRSKLASLAAKGAGFFGGPLMGLLGKVGEFGVNQYNKSALDIGNIALGYMQANGVMGPVGGQNGVNSWGGATGLDGDSGSYEPNAQNSNAPNASHHQWTGGTSGGSTGGTTMPATGAGSAYQWFLDRYNAEQGNRDKVSAAADQALGVQQDGMNWALSTSKADRQRYDTTFKPIEDRLVAEAMAFDGEAEGQRLASEAEAAIGKKFGQARENFTTSMTSLGVNPNSGKYMTGLADINMNEAAARVTGINQGRITGRELGRERLYDAQKLGANLPSQSMAGVSLSSGLADAATRTSTIPGTTNRADTALVATGMQFGQQQQRQDQAYELDKERIRLGVSADNRANDAAKDAKDQQTWNNIGGLINAGLSIWDTGSSKGWW